jgi:neogenin
LSTAVSPPVFLITPRNTKVEHEGSGVTLDCAANGVPKPFITWLKDGATIDLNHLDSRFLKLGEGSLQVSTS